MTIFKYYNKKKELERAWFDSSNLLYGECDDSSDGENKTVRLVFNNGAKYEYSAVHVLDWLKLRNAESNGKEFNVTFRKGGYECKKLEDVNTDELKEEMEFRMNKGLFFIKGDYNVDEHLLTITDEEDTELCKTFIPIDRWDNEIYNLEFLANALGHKVKIVE